MRIKAIEFQLGSELETLEDLGAANPDWNLERLVGKTGIAQHYVSAADETPLSLATQACENLLEAEDRAPIDGLIYVTQSPEPTIPTAASHRDLRTTIHCTPLASAPSAIRTPISCLRWATENEVTP